MGRSDFLGEFEQVVLLAVAHLDGRGYGVGVQEEIERRSGREVAVGSVYAALSRMNDQGLLESWEGDPLPRRGGRARRYFRLTPAGVVALKESRAMMDAMWRDAELEPGA